MDTPREAMRNSEENIFFVLFLLASTVYVKRRCAKKSREDFSKRKITNLGDFRKDLWYHNDKRSATMKKFPEAAKKKISRQIEKL